LQYLNKVAYVLFIWVIFNSVSFCVETEDPIRNGGGARPLGLGRAVTAVLDDINSAFYNPAGLVGLKSAQFMGMYYTKVYGNYHYFVSAGGTRMDWGVIGIGFISSGIGQVPITTAMGTTGYTDYTDNLLFVSYANSLRDVDPDLQNIFYGTNVKFFSKGTTGAIEHNGTGYNIDIGLKYIPVWWLAFGATKQNVFGESVLNWNTGPAEQFPSPLFLGVAVKNPAGLETYSFDTEFPSAPQEPALYHLGMEYPIEDYLVFRLGNDQIFDSGNDKTAWNPAIGLGFILKGITIDYTYHSYYEDAGDTAHFLSLSFNGGYESDIRATAGIDSKKTYLQREEVPVAVKVPFEASTVIAEAPNQEKVVLSYDFPSRTWVGKWYIPKDFRPEAYVFNVTVLDLQGKKETTITNDFHVQKKPEAPKIAERDAVIMLVEKHLERKLDLNALVKRKELAVIIAKAKAYELIPTPETLPKRFKDIDLTSKEAMYIEACYEKKAMSGYEDGTFRPENDFSLASLISMMSDSESDKDTRIRMWQYLKKTDKSKLASFNDIIDAVIASGYLKSQYNQVVPSGTVIVYQ
jgi:hypothetical protein